ncbi:Uncharacterised protein [Capnocytophaga ochracea]|uniref:Uncharacterized protein n=1 Tax=Capnocytophaga ochracea TaxID=1018 RepID=A0A2X2UY50_CAPOC|nr:Uncharacterised protein [Capnocytophaga ochracea]
MAKLSAKNNDTKEKKTKKVSAWYLLLKFFKA